MVKPSTNYAAWKNADTQNCKLILEDEDVSSELNFLSSTLVKANVGTIDVMKEMETKVSLKMGKHLPAIPPNNEVMIVISVSGIFVQNASKIGYLQMEVSEITFRPICLLTPSC